MDSELYHGKFLNVHRKSVVCADGRAAMVEYIDHPGAVLIVPVLDDGRIVMIRQYRAVLEQEIWELPAGTLEDGEDPASCAYRELEEETGYRAHSVERIGEIVPVPGYSTERIVMFRARGLERGRPQPMSDERITVHPLTRDEVDELVVKGQIIDAKTLSALYLTR